MSLVGSAFPGTGASEIATVPLVGSPALKCFAAREEFARIKTEKKALAAQCQAYRCVFFLFHDETMIINRFAASVQGGTTTMYPSKPLLPQFTLFSRSVGSWLDISSGCLWRVMGVDAATTHGTAFHATGREPHAVLVWLKMKTSLPFQTGLV